MGVARIPFDVADEKKIVSAAQWGIITAVTSLVSISISAVLIVVKLMQVLPMMSAQPSHPGMGGLLSLMKVAGTVLLVVSLVAMVITVLLDVWLIQASLAFRKVAVTDVADQHYLLLGFAKLRNYFMLMGIMLLLSVLAAVGMFVVGLAGRFLF